MQDKDIEKLFDTLDKDKKGYLEASDLSRLIPSNLQHSRIAFGKALVERCDQTLDGKVTLLGFEKYYKSREQELFHLFHSVSRQDRIGLTELEELVKKYHIPANQQTLLEFLKQMDLNNDGYLDFEEWKAGLMFVPKGMKAVLGMYQVDFNSDAEVTEAPTSSRIKYLLAGGVAGAVSRTCTAPLDRLKVHYINQVLLQTETKVHRQYSHLVSIRKGLLKIYQTGGILSFFKGNGLNVLKIIPESALKFYVFENTKTLLAGRNGMRENELGMGERLIAGGMGGLVSQFAIYPIETIKTRLMSQILTNGTTNTNSLKPIVETSIPSTIKHLYQEGGIRAFYRGCAPALVGIVPYAGVDLAVFETLKSSYATVFGTETDRNMPIPVMLCCGMFSGTCGAVLMYPLSLVRTRLQAQGTPSHPTYYKNAFDVIRKTYQREGLIGFYRGLAPTLLKVLPAVSISYVVYEHSKIKLGCS